MPKFVAKGLNASRFEGVFNISRKTLSPQFSNNKSVALITPDSTNLLYQTMNVRKNLAGLNVTDQAAAQSVGTTIPRAFMRVGIDFFVAGA
jgi:hypothetical protein